MFAAAVNPPVPVNVKPVVIAIAKFTCAAVVVANIILKVLKLIALVFALDELNMPVVKLAPKVNVPAVNVYVPVAVKAYALFSITEPEVWVNVGTGLNVAVSLYVNTPGEVTITLVDGVTVPDEKLYAP